MCAYEYRPATKVGSNGCSACTYVQVYAVCLRVESRVRPLRHEWIILLLTALSTQKDGD